MSSSNKSECIIYVGDFDLRNENVQSFLVRSNANIFKSIGYEVAFIGINTKVKSFVGLAEQDNICLDSDSSYLELPSTLNFLGLFKIYKLKNLIINYLNEINKTKKIKYLISYQCPSYSILLNSIIKWCKLNSVKYIVNCADLPTFDIQPIPRKYIMTANWSYLHKINKREADGIIAVSKFIADYYHKDGRNHLILPPLFDEKGFTPRIEERTDTVSFVYAGTPFKTTGGVANVKGMKDRLDKVIDLFLELTEQNVPYSFKIVGIQKSDYLTGVPRHADSLSRCKSIEFLGRLSHTETLQIVSNSDYSINYRDENLMTQAGFSTKIVESISVGTPIVMNSISDTFEYIKEGVLGFMLSGDSSSDVDLLKRLCRTSKDKRKDTKQYCFDSGVFHFDKYTQVMRQFLESL
ncbi:glycosyltransferase involved in cell wall biosynthesis [Ruminococcaceae bacterium R-25]|nr:glycosyltransferase involved in cell wall biosynthesis [Ruminococcaceae bacterium R-25]SUQ11331.1 Glycosyltransferase involved in cell wall bisynthesis [Oscillospiraceae bacterium]